MANSDKNILITPNKGSSSNDPTIAFTAADASSSSTISLNARTSGGGSLQFQAEGGGTLMWVRTDTTASNQTTGAVIVGGGLGVSGDIYAAKVYSNGTQLQAGLSREEAFAFSIAFGS